MKLEFLAHGGGSGGGEALPRRMIEERMRALGLQPLDDARRPIRIRAIAAALFLGVFALFVALAPFSSAAIASASISVTGDKLSIQPQGAGVISEVLVHEGQAVVAGQPLVRLNGVRSGATQQQAKLASMKTRDSQAMTATQQLDEVQAELAQLRPPLDVTRYLASQDVLRAPAAGRVSGLTQLGPGTVVGAGRQLLEIVPTGRPLIVDAQVKPEDVSDVRLGQPTIVRFTSINPHGRSAFPGHVTALSPARIEAQGGSYYKAEIALDNPGAVRRSGLTLQPGLPASVNVKMRARGLFAYLAAPLTDAMRKAFRQK